MQRKRKRLIWADLDELLRYEPHTGKLIWRTNKHSKSVVPNTVAGCINKATGYRSITIFDILLTMAWFLLITRSGLNIS